MNDLLGSGLGLGIAHMLLLASEVALLENAWIWVFRPLS